MFLPFLVLSLVIQKRVLDPLSSHSPGWDHFRLCKSVLAPGDSSVQCCTVSLLCFITGASLNNQTIHCEDGVSRPGSQARDIFQFQILELNNDDPLNAEQIGI